MNKEYPLNYYKNLKSAHLMYESSDKSFFIFNVKEEYEFPYTVELKYEFIDHFENINSGYFYRDGREIVVNRLVKLPDNKCNKCGAEFEPYENCYVNKYTNTSELKTVIRVYGAHSHICEKCAASYQRVKVFEDDGYYSETVNHIGATSTSYGKSKADGVSGIYDEDAPKAFDYESIGQRAPKKEE